MHRNLSILILIIALLGFTGMHAQEDEGNTDVNSTETDTFYTVDDYKSKLADISFNALYPVNTFGDILDRNLYGFSASYLIERRGTNYNF